MKTADTASLDAFKDDQATADRAAKAIRIIAAALDAMSTAGSVTRAQSVTARVFPLAFGWFAAIVRNGQLVALAHENGLRHECAANVRLVLQHALALQWVIEGGDPAAAAVEAHGLRHAFDLVRELTDTGWPLPAGWSVQPGTRPAQGGALEHESANFKAMCALYDGGPQLYVPYKVASAYAHPSCTCAMAYIVPETGELSPTAVTGTYAYLLDTARCVIQAGHAFAPLLNGTVVTDAVDQAEAALGTRFGLWQRS